MQKKKVVNIPHRCYAGSNACSERILTFVGVREMWETCQYQIEILSLSQSNEWKTIKVITFKCDSILFNAMPMYHPKSSWSKLCSARWQAWKCLVVLQLHLPHGFLFAGEDFPSPVATLRVQVLLLDNCRTHPWPVVRILGWWLTRAGTHPILLPTPSLATSPGYL